MAHCLPARSTSQLREKWQFATGISEQSVLGGHVGRWLRKERSSSLIQRRAGQRCGFSQREQSLFYARWHGGLGCTRCGSHNFCRPSTRRATFQYNRRKRQLSLLPGTLFQSTKLPTTWFLAICLLSRTKNGISAVALGRKLGVNSNAA